MFIIFFCFSYFAADDNRELDTRANQREEITAEAEAPAAEEAISAADGEGVEIEGRKVEEMSEITNAGIEFQIPGEYPSFFLFFFILKKNKSWHLF